MSNRDWLDAFASGILVGAFFLFIGFQLYPTGIDRQSDAEKACAEQQKQDALFRGFIGLGEEQAPSSNESGGKPPSTAEQQPDYCDLAAQQSMANATLGMEWATWLMTLLTLFAVILIYRTLHATKETLNEAGKATAAAIAGTKAAQDTVAVTRETANRQLRAYISTSLATISGFPGEPKVTIGFKNSGQTPASDACVRALRMLLPRVAMQFDVSESEARQLGDIGPGGVKSSYWMLTDFADADEDMISSGEIVFVITGDCRYRDAFGQQQTTNFRFEMDGTDGLTNRALNVCDGGNNST